MLLALPLEAHDWYAPRRFSRAGLAFVVLAHVLVFAALLWLPASIAPRAETVLSVSLLPIVEERTPPLAVEQPQPQPKPIAPAQPRPQPERLAVAAEAPAPSVATVPPPPAETPVVAPTVPTVASAPSSAVAAPAVAAALPSQPRFDADYLDNPKPLYPLLARRMGEEGRVVLRVRVAANGLPADVQVHSGSGSPRLDQAALETVRRWKFVPARLGHEAVAATVLVPIAFSLKD